MSRDFDTFVGNAAIGDSGPTAEIPVELVRRTFETNVFSNLELTQHVIRKFFDAGTRGRIVLVTSFGSLVTAYGLGPYCASKHVLEALCIDVARGARSDWHNCVDDQPRRVRHGLQ